MSIRAKIILGFALSLLTLGLLGGVEYQSTARHTETAHFVTEAQRVLSQLHSLLAAVVDAETGERGYLLTGDERYLGPYSAAVDKVPGMLAMVRSTVADDPRQAAHLDVLGQLIGERLYELKRAIEVRRAQGLDAAVQQVKSNRGVVLMDRIRQAIAQMEAEETAVLQRREMAEARSARATLLLIGGGTLLALLVLSLGSVFLIRSLTVPIGKLMVGVEKIGSGTLGHRIGMATGDEIGTLAAAFDRMAERRQQAEELLARQTQERQHFYENISHELRTPLSLILGPVERLLATSELSEEQRRDLLVVRRNARTLLKHANDLLDAARLEAGRIAPAYANVNLMRLLHRAASHFDSLSRDRGVDFAVVAPPVVPAQVDPDMFQRIVINLLSNAFKFVKDGGKVTCSLREAAAADGAQADQVVLEVGDDGPGIPMEQRQAVFERFSQVKGGPVLQVGGTGLGLSIVKDFVTLHGGTVEILDAPQGGALFRVHLPLRAPEGVAVRSEEAVSAALPRPEFLAEASAVPGAAGAPGVQVPQGLDPGPWGEAPVAAAAGQQQRGVVLVVEDNAEMNRFLVETLSSAYEVDSVRDGQEGLERAVAHPPDVILTDVMMPRLSGDQMIRALRQRPELLGVPIIVLTAKADDDLRMRLLGEGAQDYLLKPFFPAEVRLRVGNLMASKRARDVLRHELSVQQQDLLLLAGELAERKRQLEAALNEMRTARDEAERSSQIKSNFLSLLSHEVRTPLTSLQLQVELLRRTSTGGNLMPRQMELIERIARSARRVLSMMESILQYAKLQSGRLQTSIEPLDLPALCQDLVEELSPQAQHKGLSLRFLPPAVGGPLPPAHSDRHLLHRVLMNLLTNAIKYTESGSIEVAVSFKDRAHSVAISDTGPGIPEELHGVIFEPFEQLEPIKKKHKPGVGLGLAIVKRTLTELGGCIELHSTLGHGSTFTVVLPSREV